MSERAKQSVGGREMKAREQDKPGTDLVMTRNTLGNVMIW